jgi:uncharacterized protein GlcG (DUF336 family)
MVRKITLEDAFEGIQEIIKKALKQPNTLYDAPIAVTVVGADARRIASASMDGVKPVSINLSENKAYTAVVGQRETLMWEQTNLDSRNFGDPKWTNFGGGVPITVNNEIIGAIGVSGRLSSKHSLPRDIPKKSPPQDHELAEFGVKVIKTRIGLIK